ncbi:hypothetical protein AgCh_001051 [Apium graveolens]
MDGETVCDLIENNIEQFHLEHILDIFNGSVFVLLFAFWQLATAKMGTPLFELYVKDSEEFKDKKQAIYLKHMAAAQDEKGIDYEPDFKPLSMPIIHLTPEPTTDADRTVESILSLSLQVNPSNATNPIVKRACSNMRNILSGNADGKLQNAIWIDYAIGNFKKKNRKRTNGQKSEKIDEEEEHQQSSDNVQEEYRAIDHLILDIAESMGKGKLRKNEDQSKFWPVVCNQALNRLPVLSGLTMFNKIMDAALSDPLTGLYTASNGYLITEVIQFTRKFGQWQENSEIQNYSETESDEENEEIKDPSEVEPCDFIEAVKLTGDPDVPAGQASTFLSSLLHYELSFKDPSPDSQIKTAHKSHGMR